nr:hypothetical protein [Nocardia australiensis]
MRFVPVGYSALLALVITGPLLGSGYLLLRDAVSTPRSYLTDAALGLGDAAPRAVPQDALLAVLSPIVDGGLIVKAIVLLALWAAGYGAAVLVRELLGVSLGPQLVAATVAVWNPYVAERLLQGHWSLLAGYAALPWIALAAYRIRVGSDTRRRTDPASEPSDSPAHPGNAAHRDDHPEFHRANRRTPRLATTGAWAALAGCFAAAGLTPTGALLAGCTAVVLVGRRNILPALILLLAASAPWLTATALSGAGSEPSDPVGITAFAARAEPGLGTLGSLAGLGGIWNSDAVPDSRTTSLAFVATILLLALVATGIRAVACTRSDHAGAATSTNTTQARTVNPFGTLHPPSMVNHPGTVNQHCAEHHPGATYQPDTAHQPDTTAQPRAAHQPSATHEPDTTAQPRAVRQHTAVAEGGEQIGIAVRRRLLMLAAVAIILPALGATGSGMAVMEWLVTRVPGAGLLRDTQKYVALAMPAYALCVAAGCRAVASWLATSTVSNSPRNQRRTDSRTPLMSLTATVFIALLTLPLFDLAWGVGGALRPVHYPIGWQQVAEKIDGPGDVAVLPGGMFRKFPYSGHAPVLDPAPRMLPNDVLQTGELPVRGRTVAGEGTRARDVESLLLQGGSAQELADLGVGWVLTERTTPGPLGESKTTLAQLIPIYIDTDLALYRVPGTVNHHNDSPATHRRISNAAHLIWAALLISAPLLAPANQRTLKTAERSTSGTSA